MFTGLIEDTGRLATIERRGEAGFLRVETALPVSEIATGDSIAVNGACLTVTGCAGNILTFDVSPESFSRSTIGALRTGCSVNLERALKLGDRLGGHIVTGHVDCIASLARSQETAGNRVLNFTLPPASTRYLVEKGSVTIDGISLTVNSVGSDGFSVNIIPLTFSRTTLSKLRVGDKVNIETDIIGKYVERLLQPWKQGAGLSMKTLAENGFV